MENAQDFKVTELRPETQVETTSIETVDGPDMLEEGDLHVTVEPTNNGFADGFKSIFSPRGLGVMVGATFFGKGLQLAGEGVKTVVTGPWLLNKHLKRDNLEDDDYEMLEMRLVEKGHARTKETAQLMVLRHLIKKGMSVPARYNRIARVVTREVKGEPKEEATTSTKA